MAPRLGTDGFFSAQRTIGEVRKELARRGFNFKSNELSKPLLRLTQRHVIDRDKDSHKKQWVYFAPKAA
jgi:hypothetical protein